MTYNLFNNIHRIKDNKPLELTHYYMLEYNVVFHAGHILIEDNHVIRTVFVWWFDTTTELLEFYNKWKRSMR